MEERARVALSMLLGAAVGGVLGYLYLTEQGQRVRERLDPMFEDVVRELQRWSGTVQHARTAADESVRTFHEMIESATAPARSAGSRGAASY